MQNSDELARRIGRLSPERQSVVEKLIQELESASGQEPIGFDEAVEEFMRDHSELMRLLAQ